jgi:hypothetical protein
MGEMRNTYKFVVRKYKGKISFGRPKRRWQGNVRMDLSEIGWEIVVWMHVAQDRD